MISYFRVITAGGATITAARILVVDQSKTSSIKIAADLKLSGYEVLSAGTALDGLKKLCQAHPDLIIMSRELPDMIGEELCFRMRSIDPAPIIILGNSPEAAVEMLELGADAYLVKPPNLRELMARVRNLLRRKGTAKQPRGAFEKGLDTD